MVLGLTPRQRDMLQAIRDLSKDGIPPTYEDLRVHLGLASKNMVWRLIDSLEKRGHLRKRAACARSIELVGEDTWLDTLPRSELWRLHAAIWARLEAGEC